MKILKTNDESVIKKKAVKLLTNCYTDFKSLIIYADSEPSIIKSLQESSSFAITLINNLPINNQTIDPQIESPLFLITPNSQMHFQEILTAFKYSKWWNIKTSFFILDELNQQCENAREILETAWKMNIIKSFFLCVNSKLTPMIYTYNPYTNRAPKPWKIVQNNNKPTNGWTMYAKSLKKGNICRSLNFDRTKHLDGSIIKALVNLPPNSSWTPNKNYNEDLIQEMYSFDIILVKVLKYSLNITFVFNVEEDGFDRTENITEFYKLLENRNSTDIAICLRSQYMFRDSQITHNIIYSRIYLVTNNRGFYTPLEKIKNFYGLVTLVSILVILFLTYSVIVLSGRRRRWAFAGFEILRLLINTGLHSRINTLAKKIFFTMIFLYFMIIHATFQGHLAAFLTKNEYRENVEKLEDLKDSRYSVIYGGPGIVPYLTDPLLKEKFVVSHPNCGSLIIGDDSAACIADIFYVQGFAFDKQLHVSREPISGSVYVLQTRDDWPLKERVDKFFMQFEQSKVGMILLEKAMEAETERQKRILAMTEKNARPLSLGMVSFGFYVLIVGLVLASVVFIVERRLQGKKLREFTIRKIFNIRR
ncbi:hypothetical protein PV327_004236 [Microctonus hyperodae]|uniref:Uncharacterized protein n=1 Tax=Microctonus hyperodae TaxID=165561 RepID=A0AA39FBY8_MICHY|nr:hypothetical protein PV327_004236 [Microctonus hyperodae]